MRKPRKQDIHTEGTADQLLLGTLKATIAETEAKLAQKKTIPSAEEHARTYWAEWEARYEFLQMLRNPDVLHQFVQYAGERIHAETLAAAAA